MPASQGFTGTGTIHDHVVCQGTINATTGWGIDLHGGVTVSNGGNVDLGNRFEVDTDYIGGWLRVNDDVSGISGTGRLSAWRESVGYQGTGTFTQTGGANTTELLQVGVDGTGRFVQTGGTNSISGQLWVGFGPLERNGDGTYELRGGQLSAEIEHVGMFRGTGRFIQTGGSNTITHGLYLGSGEYPQDYNGTYELRGGQLSALTEHIRWGSFIQTGGTNTISEALNLFVGYELSGTGELSAPAEYVRRGELRQTGGINTVRYLNIDLGGSYAFTEGELHIANGGLNVRGFLRLGGSAVTIDVGDNTLVNLSKASLSGTSEASLHVGSNSLTIFPAGFDPDTVFASFSTAGMTHTSGTEVVIGPGQGFAGWGIIDDHLRCEGTISAPAGGGLALRSGVTVSDGANVDLGQRFPVRVDWFGVPEEFGGTLIVNDQLSGISGTGQLSAESEYIGRNATGTFTQTGGTHTVTDSLYLGHTSNSSGTYVIAAGQLIAGSLYVAKDGSGTLNVTGSAADISVSSKLSFGQKSSFTAVPGSTIHMTGAAFENKSTDPKALAGLSNLTLIFEGGTEDIDPVEVAGQDMGPVLDGFQDNFALGTLQLGGADVGMIQLVDDSDNQPGEEALYVWNLNIGPSSYLDLGGLNLYFVDGAIDPGATIVGGTPTLVPEPSTATLSVLGLLLLIAFSRCRLRRPA